MKIAAIVFLGLVGLIALTFGLEQFNLIHTGYFSPRYEQVRHDTFKNSQTYNDSIAQDVAARYVEYNRAKTQAEKDSITFVVRTQLANYDTTRLPVYLQQFAETCRK